MLRKLLCPGDQPAGHSALIVLRGHHHGCDKKGGQRQHPEHDKERRGALRCAEVRWERRSMRTVM